MGRFTTRFEWGAALLLAMLVGCSARPQNPETRDVIFFVPGVAGDGPSYDGLVRGLRDGGVLDHLEVMSWGAPGPLFVMNFQDDGIHRAAEAKLATAMSRWKAEHGERRIRLIAHSAGCGVVLGALARDDAPASSAAVLLNPSVSPGFDLSTPLAKVQGQLHVFHSDKDTVFLSWRTSTFGTYDNVKTKAAGNVGFDLSRLSPPLRSKVVQHPRDDTWPSLGNDGSHFGTTAQPFVKQVIAPLLK
jgi:hypothetical protein